MSTQEKAPISRSLLWSMDRLALIAKTADEVDRCVRQRGKCEDRLGLTLGEVDWVCELHRLLYEETDEDV